MDSPQSPDLRALDTDLHRGWGPAHDREPHVATVFLAGASGGEPSGDALDPVPMIGGLAFAREVDRTAWQDIARTGAPPADPDDDDAMEAYARQLALARFARRVVDGDPHAWVEALASFWGKVPLPFDVRCGIKVDDDLSVRLALDLPPPERVEPGSRASKAERNTRYAEACCGVVLTLAADAFRVLPDQADELYVTASRDEADPATGHPRRAVLLRLATDRASLAELNLAAVTPSAALEHLGAVLRRDRGELVPLAYEAAYG